MQDEEFRRARGYAVKLLGYRQRSAEELLTRLLRKRYAKTTVEAVLGELTDLGYVDDRACASSLRRTAEEVKLLGRYGAYRYLRKMGIPEAAAEEALQGYDEPGVAQRLLSRKLPAQEGVSEVVTRRRLEGYLKRRGYSLDTMRKSVLTAMRERGR
jgi:regulatory protein